MEIDLLLVARICMVVMVASGVGLTALDWYLTRFAPPDLRYR